LSWIEKENATICVRPSAMAAMAAMNRVVRGNGAQKARVLDPGDQPKR
jgi:hypothetical protein